MPLGIASSHTGGEGRRFSMDTPAKFVFPFSFARLRSLSKTLVENRERHRSRSASVLEQGTPRRRAGSLALGAEEGLEAEVQGLFS